MDPRKQTTVTNGGWGVSGCRKCGHEEITGHYYKHHRRDQHPELIERYKRRTGTTWNMLSQHSEYYGKVFDNCEDKRAFDLAYGFTQYYCRNSCAFVSSRAYRKHTGRLEVPTNSFFKSIKHTRERWERKRLLYHNGERLVFNEYGMLTNRWGEEADKIGEELGLRCVQGRVFKDWYASPEQMKTYLIPKQPK